MHLPFVKPLFSSAFLLYSLHNDATQIVSDNEQILRIPTIVREAIRTSTTLDPILSTCAPSATEQRLLVLINRARANGHRCGDTLLPPTAPLVWNCKAADAAEQHARDMAKRGRLDHRGSNGSAVGDRLYKANYRWTKAGENVAAGHQDANSVISAWMSSSGHCNNVMNHAYQHLGAAKVERYWTVVFARGE